MKPTDPDRHDSNHTATLASEIATLEARLARLAHADDSAYEKALIRSYEQLIATRRAELALRTSAL
jgi:hypothetical protein